MEINVTLFKGYTSSKELCIRFFIVHYLLILNIFQTIIKGQTLNNNTKLNVASGSM
jgi:hypothetical protein